MYSNICVPSSCRPITTLFSKNSLPSRFDDVDDDDDDDNNNLQLNVASPLFTLFGRMLQQRAAR